MDEQIKKVIEEVEFLEIIYSKLIKMLPSFDITDKDILPYGLKPHTRSEAVRINRKNH